MRAASAQDSLFRHRFRASPPLNVSHKSGTMRSIVEVDAMMRTSSLLVVLIGLLAVLPASAQLRDAPNITGMAVQGVTVDLERFEGDRNVVVVFYRMHT